MEKHGLPTIISVSAREKEVLKWMAHGKGTTDISQVMGIRERTVKFHVGNIKKKLDAGSRAHAVAIAVNIGLIEIEKLPYVL